MKWRLYYLRIVTLMKTSQDCFAGMEWMEPPEIFFYGVISADYAYIYIYPIVDAMYEVIPIVK